VATKLELLFPTPVAFFDLGFELTEEEKFFLLNLERRSSDGNQSSVDTYLLNKAELTRIRSRVEECVTEYTQEIWEAKIDPFITQSWLNWTKPGEYHHKHNHANSLYSGVLYIDVEDDRDRISFYQSGYQQLKPEYKKWNQWNSNSWWFPIKNGQVILFPSSLVHSVDNVPDGLTGKTRVSLAFNTFAKKVGSNEELTELIL
jgi:uncharacterized protein (TIGR02466 family)